MLPIVVVVNVYLFILQITQEKKDDAIDEEDDDADYDDLENGKHQTREHSLA